eukprot:gene20381-biopygen29147
MQLPRGPPANFEKLHDKNGESWTRGMRSVIISNGCDRVLPKEDPGPLDDWLDVCAPAASASGHESPSAIVEVTPPNQSSTFTALSATVRRLSPEIEDVLMRLCCASTQIIQYARAPPPPDARFDYDYQELASHRRADGYADDSDDGDEDLQSAMSGDFGGVTPSTATREFNSTVSPVYEPLSAPALAPSPEFKPDPVSAPLLAPLPPVHPEVARPSLMQKSASFTLPPDRGLSGYNTRAREASAAAAGRASFAGPSQEPPPPPPPLVEQPPAPGPPPYVPPSLSCDSWEHLLDGGHPLRLSLQDCRLIRQAQHAGESLDRTLYGRLDMTATQAMVDSKGRPRPRRVMAYSELGLECRAFLGPVMPGINYPPANGVTSGGVGRRNSDLRGYQFVKVPLPFCHVRPDFELIVRVARSLDLIRNLDDQRAYDAGLAAEYFLAIRESLAPRCAPPAAGTSASHGESSVDPALLGFSALTLPRQEFMILSMMLANMTDALVKVYRDFASPRDIFLHIRRQQSDALASRVPLLLKEYHASVMGTHEHVDAFFRRVRGMCIDLRSAGFPQTQRHAMGIIVQGASLPRFETLRIKYGILIYNQQPVEYRSCLEEYRQLDILNIALPQSDSRHPGWSRTAPQFPANAAFQRRQKTGGGSGSNKRRLECTWRPCPHKDGHSEDRCWTKFPALRRVPGRAEPTLPSSLPANLALPGSQMCVVRACLRVSGMWILELECPSQGSSILWSFPASSDGVYKFACRPCYTTSGCSFGADNYPAFALDVDEDGGVVIPTTPEWLWHRRLGHPGYDAMHRLVKKGMVKNLPLSLNQVQKLAKIPCDACQKAKGKRLPFPKASTTPINAPLQRLHLDIMGPVHIRGLRGEFYILCLTDQHSGYAEVLCLRTRDEAPLAVQTIILRWMNQLHGFAFKCLRSDRAKEFIVKWFEDWLISVGAVHELSLAYTAQQNATVESCVLPS